MERKCYSCRYRGELSGVKVCCDYLRHTGRSRLKQVYEELGVDRLTPAVKKRLSGRNCKFFEPGAKQRLPMEPVLLPGTRPKRRESKPVKYRRRTVYDWDLAAELTAQGKTVPEIAKALGCKEHNVHNWRSREGLSCAKRFDADRAAELFKAGAALQQVADALGCGVGTARDMKKKAGLSRPPTDWEQGRKMFTDGASAYTIAAALGVKHRTVLEWAKREGLQW